MRNGFRPAHLRRIEGEEEKIGGGLEEFGRGNEVRLVRPSRVVL